MLHNLNLPQTNSKPGKAGLFTLLSLAYSCSCIAGTALGNLSYSLDTTASLAGVTVVDHAVAADNLMTTVTPIDLGMIPLNADINAYHLLSNGEHLLSFDTSLQLAGGLSVEAGDIVAFDGSQFRLYFDASKHIASRGVMVDAISTSNNGELLLSFDTSVRLAEITYDDEDLVRFDGTAFHLALDASSAGIDSSLDLDAAHILSNGHMLLSFDGSGKVGGVTFDDEDVLEYDPVTSSWELAYDGSQVHASWPQADLDALYTTERQVPGDFDNDNDVDRHDLNFIIAALNSDAKGPSDPRDLDDDERITVLDARKLVTLCTRPLCATT